MERRIKVLCKRAKKADKDAACELLKIYYTDVYAYLRRLCGNRHDAEDLTQQTFLKAWSSLDGFAGRSKFSTWLYRIAHNTYLDWLRKNNVGTQSRSDCDLNRLASSRTEYVGWSGRRMFKMLLNIVMKN